MITVQRSFTKMMIMMMNCFCGMVDRRKTCSLIFSQDHSQRSSPLRISDTLRAEFEPAQNFSSGLVEWSCAVVITTTPRRHKVNELQKNEEGGRQQIFTLWGGGHYLMLLGVENFEKMQCGCPATIRHKGVTVFNRESFL